MSPVWPRAAIAVFLVVDAVLIGSALSRHHDPVVSSRPPASGPTSAPTSAPTSGSADAAPSGPSSRTSAPRKQRVRPTIELEHQAYRLRPFATLRVVGRVRHTRSTSVAVQQHTADSWVTFPVPAAVDRNGRFVAYVDLGDQGTYTVRIVDQGARAVSPMLRVSVR